MKHQIAIIPISAHEELCVGVATFPESDVIEIQIFARRDDGGIEDRLPQTDAIKFPVTKLTEFIEAIWEVQHVLAVGGIDWAERRAPYDAGLHKISSSHKGVSASGVIDTGEDLLRNQTR